MKILNIILSVLVLLAAAASAVFSYFLYEKRIAISEGWSKLVETANANAKAIDQNSGTSAAKELGSDKLAIKDYSADGMDRSLSASKKQIRDLVAQRDAMAEQLAVIGRFFNAGVQPADLKALANSGYTTSLDKVVAAARKAVRSRDNIYGDLRRFADADEEKLKRGDASGLAPVRAFVKEAKSSRQTLNSIASRVGSSRRDGDSIYRAVDSKMREAEGLREKMDAELSRYKRAVVSRDQQIVAMKKSIDERDEEIRNLKKALGLDPKVEFAVWKKGSEEARARLKGKVTEVVSDYGYIVIDLGSQSVVKQPAGKKELEINLGLQSGVELAVVRGNELIAMIVLDKVGERTATANIPKEKVDKIQVGDQVVYKGLKK